MVSMKLAVLAALVCTALAETRTVSWPGTGNNCGPALDPADSVASIYAQTGDSVCFRNTDGVASHTVTGGSCTTCSQTGSGTNDCTASGAFSANLDAAAALPCAAGQPCEKCIDTTGMADGLYPYFDETATQHQAVLRVCDASQDIYALSTTNAPFLSPSESGFVSGVVDELTVVFYIAAKYVNVTGQFYTGAAGESVTVDTTSSPCVNRWSLKVHWPDLMALNLHHREDTATEVEITHKVDVTAFEQFDIVRNPGLDREIRFDLPFTIKFQKQLEVDARSNLTLRVINAARILAQITLQRVNVDVATLEPEVHIQLATSVQWPYRMDLHPNPGFFGEPLALAVKSFTPGLLYTTGNGAINSAPAVMLHTNCADPNVSASDNSQGENDANACYQVWDLKFYPGTTRNGITNKLDRICYLAPTMYNTATGSKMSWYFRQDCQPSWYQQLGANECPISDATNDNLATIDTFLVTEDFCPRVVDVIDLSASMASYKGLASINPEVNFVKGQNLYLGFVANSNKATIQSVELTTVIIENTKDATQTIVYDLGAGGFQAASGADNWEVYPSGVGALLASETWFRVRLVDPLFAIAFDSNVEFNILAGANVVYEENNSLLEKKVLLDFGFLSPDAASIVRIQGPNAPVVETTADAGDVETGSASAQTIVGAALLSTLALIA